MPKTEKLQNRLEQLSEERMIYLAALAAEKLEMDELREFRASKAYQEPSEEKVAAVRDSIMNKLQQADACEKQRKARKNIRFVVLVAAIITLLGTFTVFADRWGFFDTLSENFGQYSRLWGNKKSSGKPEGWQSEYYPTWVPDGYRFQKLDSLQDQQTAWYGNEKNLHFSFLVTNANNLFPNTENMQAEKAIVADDEVLVYTTASRLESCLVLNLGTASIAIKGDLNVDEIVQIANNINSLK